MSDLKYGIHLNVPMDQYVADSFHAFQPALSSSAAHVLLEESPLHAWSRNPRLNPHHEKEESGKFDIGSACHAILLEGDFKRIAVVKATDWRTKAAQETRDEARKAGMIPVLVEQMTAIEDMVAVAQEAISKSELADMFKPDGGDSEVTILWEDQGIACKSRPDRLSKDRRIIADFKTTGASAEPTAWVKGPMIGNGADLQAALGLRGLKAIGGGLLLHEPQFVFIVQEVSPPYAVSFVGFGEQFKLYADVRIDRAIKLWGKCLKSDKWPGYPSRIAWMAPPAWKTKEWDEQVEAMDKEPA